MDISELTMFFGWMAIINAGLLTLVFLTLTFYKSCIMRIHAKLLSVEEVDLSKIYLSYLAQYKVLTITFSVVPYLALKLMS